VAAQGEPRYDVLSPLGRTPVAAPAALADRLESLSGRRIAFVWDHVFHGDRMVERFERHADAQSLGLTLVPHERFGNIHGNAAEEHEAVDLLPRRLRDQRVDAAVVGVGA